uniref:NADH:ubiquinone reductase (non-electrogenic) n=1 Tax=Hemiselmis andersenii TaxID=464988 RepID=A0A6U2FK17_HEMAN|mmetsp:Transcript_32707/g.76393  ORF Transcript_32707/g.76393 Transcript_32707/m.76393 type:complete len:501 (+) Transcript_32707:282-1784(+)
MPGVACALKGMGTPRVLAIAAAAASTRFGSSSCSELVMAGKSAVTQRRSLSTGSGQSKKKVVVLGTGWGGFQVARSLDKSKYDVQIISPSNHFLFTPLLPSTTVGTLEFRCIQEPVRTIKGTHFLQAKAKSIDLNSKVIECQDIFKAAHRFSVSYDYLILAVGSKTNTFNTPGVAEREGKEVFFLKHLYHARQIRNRILECFERAAVPGISQEMRQRLLSFVVVGGGPTSCEFTAELFDFLKEDVSRWYPELQGHFKVTLVEAGPHLLGPFEASLREYVEKLFKSRNVDLRTGVSVTSVEIEDLDPAELVADSQHRHITTAVLKDGSRIPFGTMVWSAGLAPVKLVDNITPDVRKGPGGRIHIDDYCRIHGFRDVFALGDCAVCDKHPLPPIAQAAQQQGYYVAKLLNKHDGVPDEGGRGFRLFHMGSLASIGGWKGVMDMTKVGDPQGQQVKVGKLSGIASFAIYRAAYWGKQVSWANKILIPMHWFKAFCFGRDISRF